MKLRMLKCLTKVARERVSSSLWDIVALSPPGGGPVSASRSRLVEAESADGTEHGLVDFIMLSVSTTTKIELMSREPRKVMYPKLMLSVGTP